MRNFGKISGIVLVFLLCTYASFAQPSVFKTSYLKIYVNTYTQTNASWDSLAGFGYTELYNHNPRIQVPVSFENIKVEKSGTEYFLTRGTIHGVYKDTFDITPRYNPSDLPLEIYLDSLIVYPDEKKTICSVALAQKFRNDTFHIELNDWINLSQTCYPLGNLYFNDTVINMDDYIFRFTNESSMLQVDKKYEPFYNGTVQYILDNDTLDLTMDDVENLNYFSASGSDTISFTDQIDISTTSCTIDNSSEESPGIFEDTLQWEGIYFNNLKISDITQDSTFIFNFNFYQSINTIKRDSSSWLAYITEDELTVDIDTTFNNSLSGNYNYFGTYYDQFKINNLNDTLVWDVTGEIYIPYLKDHYFNYNIPCKSSAILLAETDINSAFQPFPLYEFELHDFSLILKGDTETENDTIQGEIDHENKEISISLPAITTEYGWHTVYPYFSISANDIILDSYHTVNGSTHYTFDIYGSSTNALRIVSYDHRYKDYTLKINVDESLNNENIITDTKIQVYPNPTKDYVQVSGLTEGSVILLSDINGRRLLKRNADKETEIIDISKFDSGIYFVKIENTEENISKKIIKL